MRVQVHTLPVARNEPVQLLSAQAPGTRADDAARVVDVYLTDIEMVLARDGGRPYSVYRVRDVDGKVYWWQYCRGVWVIYSVQDRWGNFFGVATRRITITRFRKEGPHQ